MIKYEYVRLLICTANMKLQLKRYTNIGTSHTCKPVCRFLSISVILFVFLHVFKIALFITIRTNKFKSVQYLQCCM